MGALNKAGSVDDIRCGLAFIKKGDTRYIVDLQDAIADEKKGANRITVIKMLEAKLRTIQK